MGIFGTSLAYFDEKVVWITGASSGLGEALVLELAREGKPRGLVISARREAELERVRQSCSALQAGLEVHVLPLDLSKTDELPECAERALKKFGCIDVLVNNGGVGFRGLGSATSLEHDRYVMDVNFFGGLALTKSLMPSWLQGRSGHVVVISSVQGCVGLPSRTAYSAARHAAKGYYDSLRAEVEDEGVTVTVVYPGYIKTKHAENSVKTGGFSAGPQKGVDPGMLAKKILRAVAARKPELVAASFDARLAIFLRWACPNFLFWIMRRRARKEKRE